MAFLTMSVLILLSIGVVLLDNIRVLRPTPQTLGLIGVLLCGASMLTPLAAKSNPAATQVWKTIFYANIYLVFLWAFLMLAH